MKGVKHYYFLLDELLLVRHRVSPEHPVQSSAEFQYKSIARIEIIRTQIDIYDS